MPHVQVTPLTLGELGTNCYLVSCSDTSETIIIDPADNGDFITTQLLEKQLSPTAIVLTHGHFDHVLGCLELKLNFHIPIFLHPADTFLLQRATSTAEHFVGHSVDPVPPADAPLADGQVLEFGEQQLHILHTPGHTPGSITAYTEEFVFSGDTLFVEEPGTADHRYSDPRALQTSIKKIKDLAQHRILLAGHSGLQ